MLNFNEFTSRIILDLQEHFDKVELNQNKKLLIKQGSAYVEISLNIIFKEYQFDSDYKRVLDMYTNIANHALHTYKFTLDLRHVYPLLKPNNFATQTDLHFLRTPFKSDIPIDVFYVTENGDLFRFVQTEDLGININIKDVHKASLDNISRIRNKIIKITSELPIYTFRYSSDLNSSLLLTTHIQNQIAKAIGNSYYFLIPSSSCVFFSPALQVYIPILKHLAGVDTDINKIYPDKIFKSSNGLYSEEI